MGDDAELGVHLSPQLEKHLVQLLELGNWPGTAGLLKHGHLTGQQPDAAV
ncbi:hypothetical protein HaLaN_32866, partial [Haematococcus lacustris]